MASTTQTFGQHVYAARRRSLISQRDLAERAGLSQSTVSRIETGELLPNTDTIRPLSDALGLSEGVQVLASFEPLAKYHGVSVAEILEDARKAQEILAADDSLDGVVSTYGVRIPRMCTSDCTCSRHEA